MNLDCDATWKAMQLSYSFTTLVAHKLLPNLLYDNYVCNLHLFMSDMNTVNQEISGENCSCFYYSLQLTFVGQGHPQKYFYMNIL